MRVSQDSELTKKVVHFTIKEKLAGLNQESDRGGQFDGTNASRSALFSITDEMLLCTIQIS